jgi:hypothetical protein
VLAKQTRMSSEGSPESRGSYHGGNGEGRSLVYAEGGEGRLRGMIKDLGKGMDENAT